MLLSISFFKKDCIIFKDLEKLYKKYFKNFKNNYYKYNESSEFYVKMICIMLLNTKMIKIHRLKMIFLGIDYSFIILILINL
jgi:uncharacterized membrane protein YesL